MRPKLALEQLGFENVVTLSLRPLDFLPVNRSLQGTRRVAYIKNLEPCGGVYVLMGQNFL